MQNIMTPFCLSEMYNKKMFQEYVLVHLFGSLLVCQSVCVANSKSGEHIFMTFMWELLGQRSDSILGKIQITLRVKILENSVISGV